MTSLSLGLSLGAQASGTPAPATIGGIEIGTVGTSGYVDGLTMLGGDDFNGQLSIVGPVTPRGKYGTTRGAYIFSGTGQHPRGSPGLAAYDVDPQHTGYLDGNKGVVPASYADMMVQSGSAITLRHRTATPAEKALMLDQTKDALGAMIHTGLSFLARAPVVFEWREKRTNTVKTHFTGWLMQAPPFSIGNDLELDFEAASAIDGGGDGRGLQYNTNTWTNGALTGQTSDNGPTLVNDQYYLYALKIDASGNVTFWLDGTLVKTYTGDQAFAIARPFYLLWTAHAYQASNWGTSPDGTMTIDWFRVWAQQHYRPLVAGPTYQRDFGQSGSIVLATQAEVWGGSVTEEIGACMIDTNEPGGTANGVTYAALPTGFAHSAGTNTLTIGTNVDKPGRLHIARYVNQPGASCEPQRIIVEIGPNIIPTALEYTVGVPFSYDLYSACDCGTLTSNASGRAKTVTVTGAPAWATYNDTTGLLTGTPTDTGNSSLTVSVTNSVGQSATKVVALNKTVPPITSFSDDFTGTTGQFLEDRTGWTLVSGAAGSGLLTTSNRLRANVSNTTGALYWSPDLGVADNYIEMNVLSTGVGPGPVLRASDINNWVQLRFDNSTQMTLVTRVAGTTALIATYNPSAYTSTDLIRFEIVGNGVRVYINGTRLTPTSGTESVASLPASNRQGFVMRLLGITAWCDNYFAGRV